MSNVTDLATHRARRNQPDIVALTYQLGTHIQELQDRLEDTGALLIDVASMQDELNALRSLADSAWVLSAQLPFHRPIEPRKTP